MKYYFADNLGSASVITSSSGIITDESDFYPYGGEIAITNGDPNHYKFTGKERDSESGLDNFGARFYGSNLGRFMSPDWALRPTSVPYAVFGDPQTLNLYTYVENAPLNKVDADGHQDSDEKKREAEENKKKAEEAAEKKPLISVKVEGGFGQEYKEKVGQTKVKAGGAIKGELEVSTNGVKISAKAEVGANAGPLKAPGVEAEKVTKNETGESEDRGRGRCREN